MGLASVATPGGTERRNDRDYHIAYAFDIGYCLCDKRISE